MEDSMDKLQQYGDELGEICEKHFPDIKRKIPKTKRRQMSSIDKLKNASQKELLSTLQTLESDMQTLQDNIHKLLDLIEDFSYTWLLSVSFLQQAKEVKVLQHVVVRAFQGGLALHLTTVNW